MVAVYVIVNVCFLTLVLYFFLTYVVVTLATMNQSFCMVTAKVVSIFCWSNLRENASGIIVDIVKCRVTALIMS